MIDPDRFEKMYAYNIRHNYGKEGSMVNYTPYSCIKIISTSVGPDDSHGCPFRELTSLGLKTKLNSYGFSAAHVNEITGYAQKGHYQLACTKYFEITMDTKLEEGINHPNQYFELSQKIMTERTGANSANKTTIQRGAVRKNATTKKEPLFDSNYDAELWEVAEQVQSQIDLTQQIEFDSDMDISQVEDF